MVVENSQSMWAEMFTKNLGIMRAEGSEERGGGVDGKLIENNKKKSIKFFYSLHFFPSTFHFPV